MVGNLNESLRSRQNAHLPEKRNAVFRVVSRVCAAKLRWRQTAEWTSSYHADASKSFIPQCSGGSSVKKMNPISVTPLRLQPLPQMRGVFRFTLAVRLVNHIVHLVLVFWSRRRLTCFCARCEGPESVSLSIALLPLPQQVGVDQRVLDGGVHVIVVISRCREAVLTRQEAGAVWIVDGHLIIQFLLFLPV